MKAPNAETWDQFGFDVALDGDTVLVGATNEDSSATGVAGDQTDNSFTGSGAAYVYLLAESEPSIALPSLSPFGASALLLVLGLGGGVAIRRRHSRLKFPRHG